MSETRTKVKELLSRGDAVKYAGQYVCTADFNSTKVVAANCCAAKAVETAKADGFADPILFYVPRIGEVFIL